MKPLLSFSFYLLSVSSRGLGGLLFGFGPRGGCEREGGPPG